MMIKDQVSITDYLQDSHIERKILGEHFSEELNKETTVLLVWHQEVNESFLASFPNVRGVVRYGVGFDKIDLDLCKKKGIIVPVNNHLCLILFSS